MKLLVLSTIFIIASAATLLAQSEPGARKSAAETVVKELQVEAKNVNQLLAKVAYKYDVPISLEVATNEDLLNSKSLRVQLKKGTIADVLNDIVKQKPSYIWEATETTIKVFPKGEYRDPMLQTLLEIRIARFTIRKSTVKANFREALTGRPELKTLLASYGVRPLNEGISPFDFESFGGDFSLDLENMSVRSILDSVIQVSKTKYWFIKRYKEDQTFFLINF